MACSEPAAGARAARTLWTLGALALPMAVQAVRALRPLADTEIPADTERVYLPLARRLLDDPAALLAHPDSLMTGPGAYLYMALLGADIAWVRWANLALALLSIALLWDAGRIAFGRAAAAGAAWLAALSPVLSDLRIIPMGEPPYLFAVTLWLWATTRYLGSAAIGRPLRGLMPAAGLAGIALAAATLTRPTFLYALPIAAVAGAVWAFRSPGGQQALARAFGGSMLLATALVGAYVGHTARTFGLPVVALGGGAALYFGSNPVLRGYEPPYMGLGHDVWTLTDALSHLSPEGDRRLAGGGRALLESLPASTLAGMAATKAGAMLFFSRLQLGGGVLTIRSWRSLLLLLGIAGVWAFRRHPMVWLLAATLTYQWLLHVPALYNQRYSVGALDVPLTLLASAGIAALWSWRRAPRTLVWWACGLAVAVGAGHAHRIWAPPMLPDPAAGAHHTLLQARLDAVQWAGTPDNPLLSATRSGRGPVTLEWRHAGFERTPGTQILVQVPVIQGSCPTTRVAFTTPDGRMGETVVDTAGLRSGGHFAWGMHALVPPGLGGTVRLLFECTPGTTIRFANLEMVDASPGWHLRYPFLADEGPRRSP